MAWARRTLADAATYRQLLYLLLGGPLGLIWFVALVTVWSLCLGLVITPFVIPLAIGLAFMTRGFAAVEAELARPLLDVDAHVPTPPPAGAGVWSRLRALFGPGFWRAQAYLWIRWFAGFPIGVALFSLLAAALGLIFAPVWVPFVHGGVHLGHWRPHTFVQSLALVPAGLVLLPVTILAVKPLAAAFRAIVSSLLSGEPEVHSTMSTGPARTSASAMSTVPPRHSSAYSS
jgi:Putative sensor